MDTKSILTLFGLNYEKIHVESGIVDNNDEYLMFAEANEELDRVCSDCNKRATVKEKITCSQNLTLHKFNGKKLTLVITKRRFKCTNCNKTWTQKLPFIEKKNTITSEVKWAIYEECKQPKSFTDIAKDHNVSTATVLNIFDSFCNEKPLPLRICICIDEFYFKVTHYNKFPAVISDAKSGRILDIVPSRKLSYLNQYFEKKSEDERKTVKFFCCDLNDTYRKIAYKWLPNAIVIADFFHVTKLLVFLVDIKRVRYMKTLDVNSYEYKFLKKNWKLFLANITKLDDSNTYVKDKCQNLIHISDAIYNCIKKNYELLEMYNIYTDYQKYMTCMKGSDVDTIKNNLEFIINKCLNSVFNDVKTLGGTLLDWSTEILNAYSDLNKYKISNGIAEANNNRIKKLIQIGYGYRNLKRLTKRILLIEKQSKSEE